MQGWFFNLYVFLKVAGKPAWWLILFLIPGVNLIIGILAVVAFARNFGKGIGFAIGLILLGGIFFPVLAFSDAQYSPTA